jgi:hypothetical protein
VGCVGDFLKVPGGREFLTHEDGMTGKGFPCILSPGTLWKSRRCARNPAQPPGTHAEQINAMRAKGIAIEYRMKD